jgi:hypothetical protein
MVNLVKVEKGKYTVFNDRKLTAQYLTEETLDADYVEELRVAQHSEFFEKDSHHEAIVYYHPTQFERCGFYPIT